MNLIENHEAEGHQLVGLGEQHVAQHLGGHHDHVGVAVDRRVAGQETDATRSVQSAQLVVLLVRERLQRRCVEGPLAALEYPTDRVVGHQRLAGPGGGAHEDVDVLVDRVDGLDLESVQAEGEAVDEAASVVLADHFRISLPTPMARK